MTFKFIEVIPENAFNDDRFSLKSIAFPDIQEKLITIQNTASTKRQELKKKNSCVNSAIMIVDKTELN